MYLVGRFTLYPIRSLGADALGDNLGELCVWRYHGVHFYVVLGISVFGVVVGNIFFAGVSLHTEVSQYDRNGFH